MKISDRQFQISVSCRAKDMGKVKPLKRTWEELKFFLSQATLGAKEGDFWCPAEFSMPQRKSEYVTAVNLVVLDVEEKTTTPPPLRHSIELCHSVGWEAMGHTTHSHTTDKPRYRLVLIPSEPVKPARLRAVVEAVADRLGLATCTDLAASGDPARLYYLPRRAAGMPFEYDACPGGEVDLLTLPTPAPKPAQAAAHPARHAPTSYGAGLPDDALIDTRNALLCISSDDYATWIEVGRHLAKHGSTGQLLWIEWSARSQKWKAGDAAKWATFTEPSEAGYKAVLAMAQRNGWANPAKRTSASKPSAAPARDTDGVTFVSDIDWDAMEAGSVPQVGATFPTLSDDDAEPTTAPTGRAWPEPEPLLSKIEPDQFPIDALPPRMQAAVREVQAAVQSPPPMIATSALTALAIAVQGLVNVKRDERLIGPVSLYSFIIAESGERKSSSDPYFIEPLRKWDAAQKMKLQPFIDDYKALHGAWEAKCNGIKSAITDKAKKGQCTKELTDRLVEAQRTKPDRPRVPRLLYSDITQEQLGYTLATEYPIGAIVSAEGGIVLGSHSMTGDQAMRGMGMNNALWSGEAVESDRRTDGASWRVSSARFSMCVQVQADTLRKFHTNTKGAARSMGLFARYLITWPESTQGFRPYREPGTDMPALAYYNKRIADILSKPPEIDVNGKLTLQAMGFTPEAKAVWVGYYNAVESELRPSGELSEVRDVASKSAENMARIACLLHVFEHGLGGAIDVEATEAAAQLAEWYLSESRRFFCELAVPEGQIDAIRLDEWLLQCGEGTTSTREAQRMGPLRDKTRLDAALEELKELGRVRITTHGKRRLIEINPALLKKEGS